MRKLTKDSGSIDDRFVRLMMLRQGYRPNRSRSRSVRWIVGCIIGVTVMSVIWTLSR